MVEYMQRNGRQGWVSLGGIFLCITGTEAMFADLGHFNVPAIQPGFSCMAFPALLTAYAGQAAYLRKFPSEVGDAFYKSIPDPLYWPTFVVAVAASIIASQAMISGAFSIISQSLSLGCFPRVKVVHTSAKYEGQVYIPEINYLLMIACVIVTAAFKTTEKIGNAYGIAVITVTVLTTCLVTLIMLVIWKTSIWLIALFFVVFASIEMTYMSAVMYKFTQGGFLPLVFSVFLMTIMWIWHYVHKERYMYELRNKVSAEYIRDLASCQEWGFCILSLFREFLPFSLTSSPTSHPFTPSWSSSPSSPFPSAKLPWRSAFSSDKSTPRNTACSAAWSGMVTMT